MRFAYIAISAALLASAYLLGGMNRTSDSWTPGNAMTGTGVQQAAASFDRMTTGSTGVAPKTDRTADEVEIAQVTVGQPAPVTPPTRPKVDESALRYFARKGDTARLQAEISRLRALYPDWTPPEDPMAIPVNADRELERMWQLYSESRYAEVRKAIADRELAESGWTPPADLLDRLSVAEARAQLTNASDLNQYDTVVRIGAETPSLLTCSEVDVLWRVAEAFARTERPGRARDAYLYVLNNCNVPSERLATVQKASTLLPATMVEDLLARERPGPDGTMEFDAIRDDLARNLVAEGDNDATITVPPQYLGRVERLVESGGSASDALLLGWYYLRRNDMAAAETWFRKARGIEDSASASQGLALTLIDRKEPKEAEEVMYRWRDGSKDAQQTYFAATANLLAISPPLPLTEEVLARIASETISGRDAQTAQQFGWYARELKQHKTAADWFTTALSWKPDDEPSAYGLALSRNELNDETGVAEIQRQWADRSERIARLGETEPQEEKATREKEAAAVARPAVRTAPAAVETAPRAATSRTTQGAVRQRGCSFTVDPRSLSPAVALARGWCLMDMNRPLEAARAFEVALAAPGVKEREDAAYGQSLAYLRAGLTSKAAVSAARAPQGTERIVELQSAILRDRAVASFNAGRNRDTILILDQLSQLGTEQQDLMVLKGYAYLNLNRFIDARRIFQALAEAGNREGAKGLVEVRRAQFKGNQN
ncbi:cellulose synthase [Rhizobiaceae bacterium n13]|uniref:Cellulose synthase n=1 Tax=Ferirhizobium litorale TaxID=2927786 RepID=A0AAE3QET1_9HYPH|nr:cellulose synthase [Fererhizobium litorale]MDI7862114.1 cellulose synthase [Fererhizobium litorale]MDI7922613.1 cellulose synthase [Fererhizobium litorale]